MSKKYSSVQIRNPTSQQHLLKLRPGQDAILSFDTLGKFDVELASDYLNCEFDGNGKYRIWQKEDVDPWGDYSSMFLGEVWIDYKTAISRVSVILDCVNKEKLDHITVVNPDCFDVRVQPHQVIEFIVYDLDFGSLDEWECEWSPLKDVELEQIGYDHLSLQAWHQYYQNGDDDPGYCYARFPRTEIEPSTTQWTRQHHFWYRFNESVLDISDVGVNNVGSFAIRGVSDKFSKRPDFSQYNLSLYLDTKKFKRGRVLHTLGLKKKEDYSHYSYSSNGRNTSSRSIHIPHKKKTLPTKREVAISNMQATSLEEGCNVLSAMPERKQDSHASHASRDSYDGEFYGCSNKDLSCWKHRRHHAHYPHHMD